jgi:hypothetical protein
MVDFSVPSSKFAVHTMQSRVLYLTSSSGEWAIRLALADQRDGRRVHPLRLFDVSICLKRTAKLRE